MEVFKQLFETFDSPMSQYKLQRVFLKIFLFNFPDDSLKVNDHDHFIFVTGSAAKIHPATFELKNSLRLWLHELRVVNEVGKPLRPVFNCRFAALTPRVILLLTRNNLILLLLLL